MYIIIIRYYKYILKKGGVRGSTSSGQDPVDGSWEYTNETSRTLFHELKTNMEFILLLDGPSDIAHLKSLVVLLGMILIKEYKEISQQEEC